MENILESDSKLDSLKELVTLTEFILSQKNLWSFLIQPFNGKNDKKQLLNSALASKDLNSYLKNYLFLLIDKNRINILPKLKENFNKRINKLENKIYATFRSPIIPDLNDQNTITKKLNNIENAKLTVDYKEDKSLLGGFTFQIENTIYNASIKNALEKFKKKLV